MTNNIDTQLDVPLPRNGRLSDEIIRTNHHTPKKCCSQIPAGTLKASYMLLYVSFAF